MTRRVALLDKVKVSALSNLIYLQMGLLGASALLQTGSFTEQNGKQNGRPWTSSNNCFEINEGQRCPDAGMIRSAILPTDRKEI